MAELLLEFRDVSLGYGRRAVLSEVSFAVEREDVLVFVGPNGAGKTTLLRAVAGILQPLGGQVVQHMPVTVGYVPQERALDPIFPLSALEVVLQGRTACLGPWRHPGAPDHDIARRALEQAEVGGLARQAFGDLSGGQKQRVLIARALASEPGLLVLDEPTAGMDPAAERALLDLLARLRLDRGLTLVLATHNLPVAANHARRIAVVDRERALFAVGPEAEMLTDETLTRLYGRPMRVRRVEGWRTVFAGGAAC